MVPVLLAQKWAFLYGFCFILHEHGIILASVWEGEKDVC